MDKPFNEDEERSAKRRRQSQSSYGLDYPCGQCSNSYWNQSSLNQHIKNYPKNKEKTVQKSGEGMMVKQVSTFQQVTEGRQASHSSDQIVGNLKKEPDVEDKKDAEPVANAAFVQQKPFRATTKAVFKNLNVQNRTDNISRPIAQPKRSEGIVIEYKPAVQRKESEPISRSSVRSDLSSISRQAPRLSISSNNSLYEDRIEKSGLPLSAAIFSRSVQEEKEIMIVWTEEVENDILVAVSLHPDNAILCIKELNIGSLNEKKIEIINKGNWSDSNHQLVMHLAIMSINISHFYIIHYFLFNFFLADGPDFNVSFTVISFGKNNPFFLKNRRFSEISEVEMAFSQHAKSRGKTINNIMRYERNGLYPLLSKSLVEKTMAFN